MNLLPIFQSISIGVLAGCVAGCHSRTVKHMGIILFIKNEQEKNNHVAKQANCISDNNTYLLVARSNRNATAQTNFIKIIKKQNRCVCVCVRASPSMNENHTQNVWTQGIVQALVHSYTSPNGTKWVDLVKWMPRHRILSLYMVFILILYVCRRMIVVVVYMRARARLSHLNEYFCVCLCAYWEFVSCSCAAYRSKSTCSSSFRNALCEPNAFSHNTIYADEFYRRTQYPYLYRIYCVI